MMTIDYNSLRETPNNDDDYKTMLRKCRAISILLGIKNKPSMGVLNGMVEANPNIDLINEEREAILNYARSVHHAVNQ